MGPNRLTIQEGHTALSVQLTDFNRLRWLLTALRTHANVRQSLANQAQQGHEPWLTDSISPWLNRLGSALPNGTHIVLWDGLNSLVEMLQKHPQLTQRPDLVYLPVGLFHELRSAFPGSYIPLFPSSLTAPQSPVGGTRWIDLKSVARAAIRPLHNGRQAKAAHQLLTAGGQIVFCGLVRPHQHAFDNFLRGSSLSELHQQLSPLVDFDWSRPPELTRGTLTQCWAALQNIKPQGPADWAALYTWVNVLHRMGTLSHLRALTPRLFVNEYGQHQHIDPYDAWGYRRNHYVDFGSTRGPDLVYPRAIDLHHQGKSSSALRLLPPDASLASLLQDMSAQAYWATCQQHAALQVQALQQLTQA